MLPFLEKNWALVLVFVLSGVMLLRPWLSKLLSPVREIGTFDATRMMNTENPLILDIRETKEFVGARLPNAVHIPLSEIKDRRGELTKDHTRPVIVYCDRGQRGGAAASALGKLGFTRVQSLRGGLRAWQDAGLPVHKIG